MTTGAEDRLELLLAQSVITGIDFVYVYESQDQLDVYFLRPPETLDSPLNASGSLAPEAIRIENIRDVDEEDAALLRVPITNIAWAVVDGRTVLRLTVERPESFALHRLTIDDPRIDPYFQSQDFSFQANCETGLDCEDDQPPPFPEEYVDFPVDYTPRDFLSFRTALLDFASQRYPRWLDRLEADVGVMLVEVMSALADEMAYAQDRISREAYLATATQRHSLRMLARLVDYELFDGQAATTWLDVTVNPGDSGVVPSGTLVADADGRVRFEVGTGLRYYTTSFTVNSTRNRFLPYFWDEDDDELPAGSMQVHISGLHKAALDDPAYNRVLLLQTNPADRSDPAIRLLVTVLNITEMTDPLTGDDLTLVEWGTPTPYLINKVDLELRANIVPATAGETAYVGDDESKLFSIGTAAVTTAPTPPRHAIVRRGANGKPIYRISLPGTDEFNLSWVYDVEAERPKPEIRLFRMVENGAVWDIEEEWDWRESLLGEASSLPFDRHFTLEDGTWDRVVGYPILGDVYVHEDYASPVGVTIRFGDGEFGMIPPEGSVFRVEYRLNTGENVQRDILTQLITPLGFVAGITNAISAVNALPPEGVQSIRTNAPEAFRSVTYRAVRPEDYAEAAERLDWVQRAGSSVRWTGSWRTIFTSADPRRAVTISRDQRRDLDEQLDRFRQAGQDAQQRPPRYADLDIEIDICADSFAYPGEVEAAVIEALVGEGGFFSPDNFTFGTPLYRGALEAAAQRAYGVRGVEEIRFRRHGWFDWKPFAVSEKSYDPGIDTIIRVQNDPAYPERGTLRVIVEGGA